MNSTDQLDETLVESLVTDATKANLNRVQSGGNTSSSQGNDLAENDTPNQIPAGEDIASSIPQSAEEAGETCSPDKSRRPSAFKNLLLGCLPRIFRDDSKYELDTPPVGIASSRVQGKVNEEGLISKVSTVSHFRVSRENSEASDKIYERREEEMKKQKALAEEKKKQDSLDLIVVDANQDSFTADHVALPEGPPPQSDKPTSVNRVSSRNAASPAFPWTAEPVVDSSSALNNKPVQKGVVALAPQHNPTKLEDSGEVVALAEGALGEGKDSPRPEKEKPSLTEKKVNQQQESTLPGALNTTGGLTEEDYAVLTSEQLAYQQYRPQRMRSGLILNATHPQSKPRHPELTMQYTPKADYIRSQLQPGNADERQKGVNADPRMQRQDSASLHRSSSGQFGYTAALRDKYIESDSFSRNLSGGLSRTLPRNASFPPPAPTDEVPRGRPLRLRSNRFSGGLTGGESSSNYMMSNSFKGLQQPDSPSMRAVMYQRPTTMAAGPSIGSPLARPSTMAVGPSIGSPAHHTFGNTSRNPVAVTTTTTTYYPQDSGGPQNYPPLHQHFDHYPQGGGAAAGPGAGRMHPYQHQHQHQQQQQQGQAGGSGVSLPQDRILPVIPPNGQDEEVTRLQSALVLMNQALDQLSVLQQNTTSFVPPEAPNHEPKRNTFNLKANGTGEVEVII